MDKTKIEVSSNAVIYEVIEFNRKLTKFELSMVEMYLLCKWLGFDYNTRFSRFLCRLYKLSSIRMFIYVSILYTCLCIVLGVY